ncbi:MAG: hypothetical protein V1867_07055 [Candidatus Falkowbacteria bacterium]
MRSFKITNGLYFFVKTAIIVGVIIGSVAVITHEIKKEMSGAQPVWVFSHPDKTVEEIDGIPNILKNTALHNGKGDIVYRLVLKGKVSSSFRPGGHLRKKYRKEHPEDIIWVTGPNDIWILSTEPDPDTKFFTIRPTP